MIGLRRGIVQLVSHDKEWSELFAQEKTLLNHLLKDFIVDIEHVGSTAIPGICAKPIIDILVGVRELDIRGQYINILEHSCKETK